MPSMILAFPFRLVLAAGLAVSCFGGSAALAGPDNREVIVVTGRQAPSKAEGVLFYYVSDPRVSRDGTVTFFSRLSGPGPTDPLRSSLWIVPRGGEAVEFAQEGDAAPIEGGLFTYRSVMAAGLTPSGTAYSLASVHDGDTASLPLRSAVIWDAAGEASVVAYDSQLTDRKEPDHLLTYLNSPTFHDDGHGAYHAATGRRDPGQVPLWRAFNPGVWEWAAGSEGPTLPVASRSQLAPGFNLTDELFSGLNEPRVDRAGVTTFHAMVYLPSPPPFFTLVGSGIWSWRSGVLEAVATTLDEPPLSTPTTRYRRFHNPAVSSDTGAVSFTASLGGPDVTPGRDSGLYSNRGVSGEIEQVLLEGDPAPGLTAGAVLAEISADVSTNQVGDLAVTNYLVGPDTTPETNSAVFVLPLDGAGYVVAREGDVAPGTSETTVFAGFSAPAINNAGQVAFLARLTGPDVTPLNNMAVYLTDRAGGLVLAARTGELLDTGEYPGQERFRTISGLVFSSGSSSSPESAALSDAGTLVFEARFAVDPSVDANGASALVSFSIPCVADWDGNGVVTAADPGAFLSDYFADITNGTLHTDLFVDGLIDAKDVGVYLNEYFDPCPGE